MPEFLDVSSFADQAVLPSDSGTPLSLNTDRIYELTAVNMYLPQRAHYVLYIKQNGAWFVLDDMAGDYAVSQHPQAAVNGEGGLPYYVVYQRMKGVETLPSDGHILREGAAIPGIVPPLQQGTGQQTGGEIAMFPCPEAGCSSRFDSDAELQIHTATHYRFACAEPTCSQRFISEAELREHTAMSHPAYDSSQLPSGTNNFECQDCSNSFDSQADLLFHSSTVHPQTSGSAAELASGWQKLEEQQRKLDRQQRKLDLQQLKLRGSLMRNRRRNSDSIAALEVTVKSVEQQILPGLKAQITSLGLHN